MKPLVNRLLIAVVMVVAMSAMFAAAASASPAWKFNETELSGTETVVGAALSSKLSVPGATTECGHFLYTLKIKNASGKGTGEITALPLFECHTSGSACAVESIEAEKLPWPAHLTAIGSSDYLEIESVNVGIVYSGELCALSGTLVKVKGTAGGLVENATQTATFNKSTFTTTGTSLKVGASSVEWTGVFPTEAFATHRLQTLSVG